MKLSIHKPPSRRQMVQWLGSAALALPYLECLRQPAQARRKQAKFAIFIYTNDGVYQKRYWPRGTETSFQLGEIMAPLEPFKDKLLILGPTMAGDAPLPDTGLTYAVRPPQHRAPMCLTANMRNIDLRLTRQTSASGNHYTDDTSSLDQVIGHRIQGDSPFVSLIFAAHPIGGANDDTVSNVNYWRGTALDRIDSADEAWQRTFGTFVAAKTPEARANAQQALRRQTAVSSFLHRRFARLKGILGSSDRRHLEEHLAALDAVETRVKGVLQAQAGIGTYQCMAPSRRDVPTTVDAIRAGSDTQHLMPLFMDILVAALRCGLTKVGSLAFGYPGGGGEGGLRMPWLGFSDAQHGVSHHNGQLEPIRKYVAMNRWTHAQVAYLMGELAKVPYAGTSMLEHTTIFLYNRHGEGNEHTNYALPNLILGGTGGYFRMGRYLQLGRTNPTNLLISVAHSMGLADLDQFGNAELAATGPLPGLAA